MSINMLASTTADYAESYGCPASGYVEDQGINILEARTPSWDEPTQPGE